MTIELIALLDNQEVGRVHRDKRGRLSFSYNQSWRETPTSYPMSLSMPLTSAEYGHEKIDPYLWGLLPDNETIIDKWAQRYHVSPRNSFGLIANVGEDCAGAIQFVRPERLDEIAKNKDQVDWLNEHEIADRLRLLVADNSAWRIQRDTGQFSLAGAQAKTAFLLEEGRWGVPAGRLPTTHIFKPPIATLDGHALNEHFCLELAASLGFAVPSTKVLQFEDQAAIVVTRYDRIRTPTGWRRIHQEDMCQALGLSPARKYQADGGPGVTDIVSLLRRHSIRPVEDVEAFAEALGFNWLIGGTDGHAKNYSVLISNNSDVRLAPIYDIASVLPFPDLDTQKARLAMKIGGAYKLRDIGIRQWRKLAADLNLNVDEFIHRLQMFAERIPDSVSEIRNRIHSEGVPHRVVDELATKLFERSTLCESLLKLPAAQER